MYLDLHFLLDYVENLRLQPFMKELNLVSFYRNCPVFLVIVVYFYNYLP